MALLLLNAGSSSLKFTVLDPAGQRVRARGVLDWGDSPGRYTFESEGAPPRSETVAWSGFSAAVRRAVRDVQQAGAAGKDLAAIDAVVHRVVHGGTRFREPVRLTAEVRAALSRLAELAPLHNPSSLETIDSALKELPEVPHVAVFDTAFHATLPPEAFTYPLPAAWTETWELRRFGFHGLSCAYSTGRAAEMLGRPPRGLRLVIAHLGNGASVTAVANGRSVDTSMGFTPLEGLMMGERSGSIDPGLLLHLQLRCGVSAAELEDKLNHASGLRGVSGVSSDMRKVMNASRAGDRRAALALAIFAHRVRQAIGSMAATLGGVDALVFTGGIGEHAGEIRADVCEGLGCLGLELDARLNAKARPDAVVSSAASSGTILVIEAREDLVMAREATACLRRKATPRPRSIRAV